MTPFICTAPIDPHVHLRGAEYRTNYLQHGYLDAIQSSVCHVIEQPNPQPWLTTAATVRDRLKKAKATGFDLNAGRRCTHSCHMGLTTERSQVTLALKAIIEGKLGVVSDKTFYVHSTGNMGILDEKHQQWIWQQKARMGYRGVSIGHFEDEDEFYVEWDPSNPISHSLRQTSEAEYVQVERQLKFASDAGFEGTFYVAHVTHPATLELLRSRTFTFKTVAEVTWHHMLLNYEDYLDHGNRVKMNPPLRSPNIQRMLFEAVLDGHADIIGTDHAPHPVKAKDSDKPPSGIPALPFWPQGISILRREGINEGLLNELIFQNANELFKLGIIRQEVTMQYQPKLWDKYGWNPFARVDH